jgi:hypothetical protein
MIDWNKAFPISYVARADLRQAGFSEDLIARLTDCDMEEIASGMVDIYCDSRYWEDLKLVTNRLLQAKVTEGNE